MFFPRRRFYRFWGCLGAVLGPSWGRLGPSLGRFGAILGRLGAILGRLGAILAPSWPVLGPSWGRFGAILGSFWFCLFLVLFLFDVAPFCWLCLVFSLRLLWLCFFGEFASVLVLPLLALPLFGFVFPSWCRLGPSWDHELGRAGGMRLGV